MKLTENTLNTLKNFSNINESILIHAGTKQSTIDKDDAILAEAVIDVDFPVKFGIYDLRNFLMNVTTLNNPELKFADRYVDIDDGNISLRYFFSEPKLIYSPPEDSSPAMDNPDVTFVLTNANFQKLLRVSALNGLDILSVIGQNGEIMVQSRENKKDSSTTANMKIGDYTGRDFDISFKISNLRMIPNDYTVKINLEGYALFENSDNTLRYFVALET